MRPAATEGTVGSSGSGRTAFEHIATILPTVSEPSSVVRSVQRIASSSPQRLASRLIDRVAREAARSSRPTASTAGGRGSTFDPSDEGAPGDTGPRLRTSLTGIDL